jgi:ribosomal protein S6
MYEAMFIFPKAMNDEQLEEALAEVRGEIEKTGGEVKNMTRMGKRMFARPMKKQDSGHYVVMNVELDGSAIDVLRGRFKLNDKVFRVQFVNAVVPAEQPEPVEG